MNWIEEQMDRPWDSAIMAAQELYRKRVYEFFTQLSKDADGEMERGLIELGWTPPPKRPVKLC